jgi:CubicO group peptidase (beta-lactamase class C family)
LGEGGRCLPAELRGEPWGSPGEVGAACCVYADGWTVVDLWGGLADREAGRLREKETTSVVASATKGAAAICAHMLV